MDPTTAAVSGVKPNVLLEDQDQHFMQGSGSKPYVLKRVEDHYTCTCPAWAFQKGNPPDSRSCKHLKELLGEAYEIARLAAKGVDLPPTGGKKKAASKKRKAAADDGAAEGGSKKAKKAKKDDGGEDGEEGANDTEQVDVLLANKFDLEGKLDPKGWWMSEKLDGIRVYWNKQGLYSRLGNRFHAPKSFTDQLPKECTLDGELFLRRNAFSETSSIVRSHSSDKWGDITFMVFDVPSRGEHSFEARIEYLRKRFGAPKAPAPAADAAVGKGKGKKQVEVGGCIQVVKHIQCKDKAHLEEFLREVESKGGEGVMLRKPGSTYEPCRSSTLLKLKSWFDAEAVVYDYEPGKNKHKGVVGSLKCKMESGKTFKVGSGMSDAQRANPPKIGAIINYRFQETTKDGVPRFPTFRGEAVDKQEPKDAVVPEHRRGAAKGEE